MQTLVIQPQEGKKGRSFQANCVAIITANGLFDEANGKTIRPVWAMFAGSDNELRPFVANLKLGRKAQSESYRRQGDDDRLEFLKTVGYYVAWQRETEGSLATLYHPDLFRLDPGMVDPKGVGFILLVPTDWAEQQKLKTEAAVEFVNVLGYPLDREALTTLVPTAYLFAAYLDRRTRCPLIADGHFYLQLLCAALDKGLASFPGSNIKYVYNSRHDWGHNSKHGFNVALGGYDYSRDEFELSRINIRHAISFGASHADFEAFLAEQVSVYFDHMDGRFVSLAEKVDLSCFKGDD